MTSPQITPISAQSLSDPKQLAAHLQSQRAASGAEEFESTLFATVLDKMEKNLSIVDEQDNDAAHETIGALGVRAISQALAQRHVLGIADKIQQALGVESPASGGPNAASADKNKQDSALMSLKSLATLPMNPSGRDKELK